MGNTHKHFWIHAALAYNNCHDDDEVHNVNEVMHDTIDTTVAVASEFMQRRQKTNLLMLMLL